MGQLTYVTLVSISLHENIMIGKNYFGTLCNPVTELRQHIITITVIGIHAIKYILLKTIIYGHSNL